MFKLRIFITLFICLLVYPGLSLAADNQNTNKKNVAIITVNNEKESWVKESDLKNLLIDPAIQLLSNRFNVSAEAKYYEKFKSAGLYSIIDLEQSVIVDTLKDENIDYVVLIQIFLKESAMTGIRYDSQMRIIDFKVNKLLYNGRLYSWRNNKPMLDNMLQIIDERLP